MCWRDIPQAQRGGFIKSKHCCVHTHTDRRQCSSGSAPPVTLWLTVHHGNRSSPESVPSLPLLCPRGSWDWGGFSSGDELGRGIMLMRRANERPSHTSHMQADPAASGANNQSFSSGYITQQWIEMLGSTSDLQCACVHACARSFWLTY